MGHHDRAKQIVTVALELAEREGIPGVTTARLARRMKFTEAALYRYFSGKAGILAAGLDQLIKHLYSTMTLELLQSGVARREGPEVILERHAKRFTARNGLLLVLLVHAAETQDLLLRKVSTEFVDTYLGHLETFFTELLEGIDTPVQPGTLAQLWLCQLLGGFLRSRLAESPWDPVEHPGFRIFLDQLNAIVSAATQAD